MADDLFHFNGVDGSTGSYLLPPATPAVLSRRAQGLRPDAVELDELRHRHELATEKVFGPGEGRDPCDLSQVGWGVVFAQGCSPAVRTALGELLDHRRRQATAVNPNYYKEFWGEDAYLPGESKSQFLARHGVGPAPWTPCSSPTTSCWWATVGRSRSRCSTSWTCSTPSVGCASTPRRSTAATPTVSWRRRHRACPVPGASPSSHPSTR